MIQLGFVRLILALSVANAHLVFIEPFIFINGGLAVILFYVISGFYMSMVITEKYSLSGKGWELRFLMQRALRLLPPYWAVLTLTLLFYAVLEQENSFTSSMGMTWYHHAMVLFANVFVIGMDILVSADLLLYASRQQEIDSLWTTYPVFIGWTVAVEMSFYIFAAVFALRSRRDALIALGTGFYLRIYFLIINGKFLATTDDGLGYSNTPWGYQVFAIVLIFFMIGWVAYLIYVQLNERLILDTGFISRIRGMAAILTAALMGEAYMFGSFILIADYNDYRVWLAVATFALLIPPLFILTRRSRIDKYLGMYSYPIYLSHIMAVTAGCYMLGREATDPLLNLVLVVAAGIVIVHVVEIPVERFRRRLR